MTYWLDSVQVALETGTHQVPVFFRDDDAGWGERRLLRLIAMFQEHGLPIDLAVIPMALSPALAALLSARRSLGGTPLGLHQHGLNHTNHEPAGRPCEFGPSRPCKDILQDLALGRARLHDLLGEDLDPIFTPPWNRCTPDTVRGLRGLGIQVLSRDHTAPPASVDGVREVPVTLDWFARKKGVRLDPAALAAMIAGQVSAGGPIGIMLHHAVMEPDDFTRLDQLLSLLATHPRVQSLPMMAFHSERAGVS